MQQASGLFQRFPYPIDKYDDSLNNKKRTRRTPNGFLSANLKGKLSA
jgi:hypothetical protein